MGEFKDHPSKKVIREQWCKPLIRFIYEKLEYKFLYLGLPGPQALDLLNWIDYIDQVIAFQCRDYPMPSTVGQSREKVIELEEKLREFERQRKLSTFTVFDGYIEEVILRGRDTNGNPFSQNDVVTIYNLDFCNGITAPLTIIDDKGNRHEVYKSETIKRLLEIQSNISSQTKCKKFIMFLTIQSNFWDEEAKRFVTETKDADLRRYIKHLGHLGRGLKKIKLLKAYMYQIIRSFFCHCDFTPEFLPVIYYKGHGRKIWLMHFTIVGSLNKQISGIAPSLQKPQFFLNQRFLSIENKKIIPTHIKGIPEDDCIQDLAKAFENSECFKQLW